jgi:hypothetical protein
MYSPIMWAEPNKLKHLKEKRVSKHKAVNQVKSSESRTYPYKFKFFDAFYRPVVFLRMLKISFNT